MESHWYLSLLTGKREMTRSINHFKLLNQCETLKQLRQIHAQVLTLGVIPCVQPLSCKILNMYTRFDQIKDAQLVYLQIPDPDLVSRTSMMSLLLQNDKPHQALSNFYQMIYSALKPDGFAIVGALSAAGQIESLGLGRALHGMIYRYELGSDTVVNNALINMYCRNKNLDIAQVVLDRMTTRDAIAWSSMLYGYTKCAGLELAQFFFDQMPQRETACWTVMITGYVQGGHPLRALELFYLMTMEGHRPNFITIVGILSACADAGALDLGCLVHGYICKISANLDVTVCNALLDMYSKNGRLDTACEVLKSILNKDIYTWTTVISGFAVHGDGRQAIEVFLDMLRSGVRPNPVTFVSLLLACSHAGLIHEGRMWFDIMCKYYKVKPGIEHYGCMVDLLSRAGLLKEAEKMIGEMRINPDSAIWRSLLSACLVHGNAELAEIAGKQILELEPDDDGVYVLLWNMYAHSERWEEALQMKKTMRRRRVIKKPGCSWIEVNGVIHEFLVEDKSHHLQNELFLILEGMEKQLRSSAMNI